jgi:hypothetical protein
LPGTELNGYDMVLEFSEVAISHVIGVILDSGDLLCDILDDVFSSLNVPFPAACPMFTATISFDPPTDVTLPPGTTNTIDMSVQLGSGGSVGSMRIIAKIDVDKTTVSGQQLDIIQIDLSAAGLLYSKLTIGALTDTNNVLKHELNQLGSIPILPIPVNRTTTDPVTILSANVCLIDDQSPPNVDALAVLLTFGGGAPGNNAGFTQSFLPPGARGAIGVNFDWVCRIIRPQLASRLHATFNAPCQLASPIPLPGDHNPQLTSLDLTLVDNAIEVNTSVSASGTGWSGTGSVSASILIKVWEGQLIIQTKIGNPDISVSLDWWVWLTSAAVGGIIGGIIAGAIGVVVGAILVPLVMWIVQNDLSGLLTNVANQIVKALRDLGLNFDAAAIGLNIVFQDATIDDIVISADVQVTDSSPIRSSGYLIVQNGQWFDLYTGVVGAPNLPGADLAWVGEPYGRELRVVCLSELARTWQTFFDLPRYDLYGLQYTEDVIVPESELAIRNPLYSGSILGGMFPFFPTDEVYGVETDEGRYSVIQVVDVRMDHIMVKYKTFEMDTPNAQLSGGVLASQPAQIAVISNRTVGIDIKPGEAQFVPAVISGALAAAPAAPQRAPSATATTTTLTTAMQAPGTPAPPKVAEQVIQTPGVWTVPVTVEAPKIAKFQVSTEGISVSKYEWSLNGERLGGSTGSLNVAGVKVAYRIDGGIITLRQSSQNPLHVDIGVTVVGVKGPPITLGQCLQMSGATTVAREVPTTWPIYQRAFADAFGTLEIPPAKVSTEPQ